MTKRRSIEHDMRLFAAVTSITFGVVACKRSQSVPSLPDATARARDAAPGAECALWHGMRAEERRQAALSAIENALHDTKVAFSPETAWCQISRLDDFVDAYGRACSRVPSPNSPISAVFEEAFAECSQLPRDSVQPRPPLHRDSAPALVCADGASAKTLDDKTAEFCSRPDEGLHGPAREWFANGSQRSDDSWANGQKVGTWFSWSEDGASKSARSYRNGRLDGPEVIWFPDGQRRTLTYYRSDLKDGVIAEWSATGQPIVLGGFDKDQKHGLWYFRKPGTENVTRVRFDHGREPPPETATFPAR